MESNYTLIITEKPSVARKFAIFFGNGNYEKKIINKVSYFRTCYKGENIVIVPAVGHLFVLEDNRDEWTYPVFDIDWKPLYKIKKEFRWTKQYLKNIEILSKNAVKIVSACDYDIEGSVIAYNIIRFACKRENAMRMKFSTLTKREILTSFENASKKLDFEQINAGIARHILDWYFGINLTRALTIALRKAESIRKIISTGRVQGATLKIIYEREKEIENFIPKPYWKIWIEFKKNGVFVSAMLKEGKIFDKGKAKKIFEDIQKSPAKVVFFEKKRKEVEACAPFDLTTLQREAYEVFGFSPQKTLEIAQTLYEKSYISYPRTSSQKLKGVNYKTILLMLKEVYGNIVDKAIKCKPKEGKKDDPAHPAIHPTGVKAKNMSIEEKKIYDMIARRFIACFLKNAIFEEIKVKFEITGNIFVAYGKKLVQSGWIEAYIYARVRETNLPEFYIGEIIKVFESKIEKLKTKPKERYTQASLLKKMELLGLGTKGTRAHIIQTLYERKYISGKSIRITELGKAVIETLNKYCKDVVSIDLTKKFENDMNQIMEGKKSVDEIVENAKNFLIPVLKGMKNNEKNIGEFLLSKLKLDIENTSTIGVCECGGKLVIREFKGKRFVGCMLYPKCKVIYSLPSKGSIKVMKEKCENCGLYIVKIKEKKKRAWKLCVKCGKVFLK